MPYTVEDYYRDFTKRHIDWLTPEERLKGIAPEERIKDLSPDALEDLLFSDRILEHINPEQKARLLRKLHGD